MKQRDTLKQVTSKQIEELQSFKAYGNQNLMVKSEYTNVMSVFEKGQAKFALVVGDWERLKASRKTLVTRKLKNDAVREGWEFAMMKLVESVDGVKRCMTPRPDWDNIVRGLPELETVADVLRKEWPLSYELPWQEPIVLEAEQFSQDKFEMLQDDQNELYDVSADKEKEMSHLQNCCQQLSKIVNGVEKEGTSIGEASAMFEGCVKAKKNRPGYFEEIKKPQKIIRPHTDSDSSLLRETTDSPKNIKESTGEGSGFSCAFVSLIKQRLKEVKESESIAAKVMEQRKAMATCEKELLEVRQQLDEYLKMETIDDEFGDERFMTMSRRSFDDDSEEMVGLGTSDNVSDTCEDRFP